MPTIADSSMHPGAVVLLRALAFDGPGSQFIGKKFGRTIKGALREVPVPKAKRWTPQVDAAGDIETLHMLLADAAPAGDLIVVHGALDGGATTAPEGVLRRLRANGGVFVEVPRSWVPFDLDNLRAPSRCKTDEARARWVRDEVLGAPFAGAACVVQWTSSYLVKSRDPNRLRLRLWFWLDAPASPRAVKAWAMGRIAALPVGDGVPLDVSIYDGVHPIYITPPRFEDGVADPVGERLWILPGAPAVDRSLLPADADAARVIDGCGVPTEYLGRGAADDWRVREAIAKAVEQPIIESRHRTAQILVAALVRQDTPVEVIRRAACAVLDRTDHGEDPRGDAALAGGEVDGMIAWAVRKAAEAGLRAGVASPREIAQAFPEDQRADASAAPAPVRATARVDAPVEDGGAPDLPPDEVAFDALDARAQTAPAVAEPPPLDPRRAAISWDDTPQGIALALLQTVFDHRAGCAYVRHQEDDYVRVPRVLNGVPRLENHYRRLGPEDLVSMLHEIAGADSDATPNKVKQVAAALRAFGNRRSSGTLPLRVDFEGDGTEGARDLLALQNGVLDLRPVRHGRPPVLRPYSVEFLTTGCLPFAFDAQAACPTFDAFLDSLFEASEADADGRPLSTVERTARVEEQKRHLLKVLGYALLADNPMQKMFLFLGQSRAGKGVLQRLIERLVGPDLSTATQLDLLGTDFGLQSIVGRQVVIIGEANACPPAKRDAVRDHLKRITGGDTVGVNRKHKESIAAAIGAKFILAANEFPPLLDNSEATLSRLVVVWFRRGHVGREDLNLETNLRAELPGILNRIIREGLAAVFADGGFATPAEVRPLMDDLADTTSPLRVFVREHLIEDPKGEVDLPSAFARYLDWCAGQGIERPMTRIAFGRALATTTARPFRRRWSTDARGRRVAEQVALGWSLAPTGDEDAFHEA